MKSLTIGVMIFAAQVGLAAPVQMVPKFADLKQQAVAEFAESTALRLESSAAKAHNMIAMFPTAPAEKRAYFVGRAEAFLEAADQVRAAAPKPRKYVRRKIP